MRDADYRKVNDGSLNSSAYHKRDGTAVRAKLKVDTRLAVRDAVTDSVSASCFPASLHGGRDGNEDERTPTPEAQE